MVRTDHFRIVLPGPPLPLAAAIGCRWWVGQAGRRRARSTVSNLWQVKTQITGGSGAAQLSTMFFDQPAGATAQDAANAVRAFWDGVKTKVSNLYSFQVELAVEDIDIATGKPVGLTAVTAAVVTGTIATGVNPWQTQGLIQWRSGVFLGGRELRGRTFIPGTLIADEGTGVPTASYITTLNTAASTLASDPNSSLAIYSRKKRAIGVVTSGQAWNKWAVLRSRRD